MLRVNTYLDKSKIHGIGLFAKEFIPKDTVVWEYNRVVDSLITPEELEEVKRLMKPPVFEDFRNHISKISDELFILYGDNAKFINHSEKGNISDVDLYSSIANRDIKKGEELTEDYLKSYFNKEDIGFLKGLKK